VCGGLIERLLHAIPGERPPGRRALPRSGACRRRPPLRLSASPPYVQTGPVRASKRCARRGGAERPDRVVRLTGLTGWVCTHHTRANALCMSIHFALGGSRYPTQPAACRETEQNSRTRTTHPSSYRHPVVHTSSDQDWIRVPERWVPLDRALTLPFSLAQHISGARPNSKDVGFFSRCSLTLHTCDANIVCMFASFFPSFFLFRRSVFAGRRSRRGDSLRDAVDRTRRDELEPHSVDEAATERVMAYGPTSGRRTHATNWRMK